MMYLDFQNKACWKTFPINQKKPSNSARLIKSPVFGTFMSCHLTSTANPNITLDDASRKTFLQHLRLKPRATARVRTGCVCRGVHLLTDTSIVRWLYTNLSLFSSLVERTWGKMKKTLERLIVCWDVKCPSVNVPAVFEVAGHCMWFMESGWPAQWEEVELHDEKTGEWTAWCSRKCWHYADQHENNSDNGGGGKGRIGAREPSCHFAAVGKKLTKW